MSTDLLEAFVVMGGLIVINTVGVAMVLLQMPGTWVIFLATTCVAWLRWEQSSISVFTLALLLMLAILGEVVETAATATTTRRAGGGWGAAILAMIGAIVGAIVGTIVIQIPVIGTLVGACLGAGLFALGVTRLGGTSWEDSCGVGVAAAKGRLWGTVAKVSVACVMWLISLLAAIVP